MKQEQYFKLENELFTFDKFNQEGINIYFSSKNDGVSTKEFASNNQALHVGDIDENVIANRRKHASKINRDLEQFIYTNQTHSDNTIQVTKADAGSGIFTTETAFADTDGLYTFENDIVLNAFVADCTPVYFFNSKANLIGVIHAGWQGTVKSIVYKALTNICKEHDLNPSDFKVVIGPSIEMRNFEVGQDVIDLIDQMDYLDYKSTYESIGNGKYKANVKRLNYLQAKAAGVKTENIYITDLDTYSNDNLFSFRQNNKTGRMCASIYQTNNK